MIDYFGWIPYRCVHQSIDHHPITLASINPTSLNDMKLLSPIVVRTFWENAVSLEAERLYAS
jgi:hypothetical protein